MGRIVKVIGIGLLVEIIFAIVLSFPVAILWNWLMPKIFGLCVIEFWEAAGLILLCEILFSTNIKTSCE